MGGIKGQNAILSFHIVRSVRRSTCNSNERGYSHVVNEKLIAASLHAEALAGDFGAVDGHQIRVPGLEPPAVPLLRERAAWNRRDFLEGTRFDRCLRAIYSRSVSVDKFLDFNLRI